MISVKETDDVSGAARPAGEDPPDEADGPEESTIEAPEEDFGPQPPPPPNVAELAAACVRFVATRYNAALDFAPDTLSFVDHWVREARAELAERPEAAEIVQAAAGAYLGEVIRRTFGGYWVAEGDHADWRLELERVYCAFNPIGMAREALLLERLALLGRALRHLGLALLEGLPRLGHGLRGLAVDGADRDRQRRWTRVVAIAKQTGRPRQDEGDDDQKGAEPEWQFNRSHACHSNARMSAPPQPGCTA